eukprot:GEMP01015418.1.p1 GENE.GEMP01015418.1~~GEMP01015418.1.p1  ORF type:complete len:643 (+),score=117.47 GEMP01015418.1:40-1968(+)
MQRYTVLSQRARPPMFALCWLTSSLASGSGSLPGSTASLQFLQPRSSGIVSTALPATPLSTLIAPAAISSITTDDEVTAWTDAGVIVNNYHSQEPERTATQDARASSRSLRGTNLPTTPTPSSSSQFYDAVGLADTMNGSHSDGVTLRNFKQINQYERDAGISWDVGAVDPTPELSLIKSLGSVYSFEFILNHKAPDTSILHYEDFVDLRLENHLVVFESPLKSGTRDTMRTTEHLNCGWHHYIFISNYTHRETYVDGEKKVSTSLTSMPGCLPHRCTNRGIIGPMQKMNVILRRFVSFDSALSEVIVRERFDAVGWIQEMVQILHLPTERGRDDMDDDTKEELQDIFVKNIRATLLQNAHLTDEQASSFHITTCDIIFPEDRSRILIEYIVAIQQNAQRQLHRTMTSNDTWSEASFLGKLLDDVQQSSRNNRDGRVAIQIAQGKVTYRAPELAERYFLPREAELLATTESTTTTKLPVAEPDDYQASATSVSSIVWIIIALLLCSSVIFIAVAYFSQHRQQHLRPPPPEMECSSVISESSYTTSSSFLDSEDSTSSHGDEPPVPPVSRHSRPRAADFPFPSSFSDGSAAISAAEYDDRFDTGSKEQAAAETTEDDAQESPQASKISDQVTDGTGIMSVASF